MKYFVNLEFVHSVEAEMYQRMLLKHLDYLNMQDLTVLKTKDLMYSTSVLLLIDLNYNKNGLNVN